MKLREYENRFSTGNIMGAIMYIEGKMSEPLALRMFSGEDVAWFTNKNTYPAGKIIMVRIDSNDLLDSEVTGFVAGLYPLMEGDVICLQDNVEEVVTRVKEGNGSPYPIVTKNGQYSWKDVLKVKKKGDVEKIVQVRQGVFETNSSSTHSISIEQVDSEYLLDVLMPNWSSDKNDGIEMNILRIDKNFGNLEFGWEYKRYYNMNDKIIYAYLYAIGSEVYKHKSKTEQIIKERVQMLEDLLLEHSGAISVQWYITNDCSKETDECSFGFIDHASLCRNNEIFLSKENLRSFLFNKKSYIEIDNDNDCKYCYDDVYA